MNNQENNYFTRNKGVSSKQTIGPALRLQKYRSFDHSKTLSKPKHISSTANEKLSGV